MQASMDRAEEAANASPPPARKRTRKVSPKPILPVGVDLQAVTADVERQEDAQAAAARQQQEAARKFAEAVQKIGDSSVFIEERIATAREAGFSVAFRGPRDRPRRIIFRGPAGTPRIVHKYPMGKNAAREIRDAEVYRAESHRRRVAIARQSGTDAEHYGW
jgi:hypothetical protein